MNPYAAKAKEFFDIDDMERARKTLDQGIEEAPSKAAPLYVLYGASYLKEERVDEAFENFESAKKLDPSTVGDVATFALAFIKDGKSTVYGITFATEFMAPGAFDLVMLRLTQFDPAFKDSEPYALHQASIGAMTPEEYQERFPENTKKVRDLMIAASDRLAMQNEGIKAKDYLSRLIRQWPQSEEAKAAKERLKLEFYERVGTYFIGMSENRSAIVDGFAKGETIVVEFVGPAQEVRAAFIGSYLFNGESISCSIGTRTQISEHRSRNSNFHLQRNSLQSGSIVLRAEQDCSLLIENVIDPFAMLSRGEQVAILVKKKV